MSCSPAADPLDDLLDRRRLVAGGLVVGDDLEGGDAALEIGHWTHASSLRRTTDNGLARRLSTRDRLVALDRSLDCPREPSRPHRRQSRYGVVRRSLSWSSGPSSCSPIALSAGRLLPPPRQEAQALPGHARRSTVEVGEGTLTTYTFGQDLYDDMLAAIDGAQKQILFETYIWKGDEIGERFKTALIAAAERGVEVYCIYDGFANLVVSPRFMQLPALDQGAALPRLAPPACGSGTCAATAATTARSSSSTRRSASSAATTSARPTPPSGATRTSGSPGRACGTSSAPSPTSGTSTAARASAAASGRCCSRPRRSGSRGSGSHATCRGCGSSRSESMYLEAINRATHNIWMTHAYFIPDQDFVDALKEAARRGSRRPPAAAAEVQPHRGRLDLARLLLPAAPRRRADPALQGRDGARQDRRPSTATGPRSAPPTSTGSASRATTRSTSR